ncbi:MAG: hypothetical protein HZB38_05750 [Planctomycetes bacterium]|nr:hypothetical protein [Planctomycetota bacterium]
MRFQQKLSVQAVVVQVALSLAAAAAALGDAPRFAVRSADGRFHACEPKSATPSGYAIQDDHVEATVASTGAGQWELTLKARTALSEIWFPWPADRIAPRAAGGAFVYMAEVGGARVRADSLKEFAWAGAMYPTGCFAPLVIHADGRAAHLVAAINWPPRPVRPLYSLDRLALRYDEHVAAGATVTRRAMVRDVAGDEAAGRPPWLLAVDEYREWLVARMREEHLLPIEYPQWLRESDGWIFVNVANMPRFDVSELESKWQRWSPVLPWMQIWGQMSNYDGPRHLASPPVGISEETGCCLDNLQMHARYLPELPAFARHVALEGRIGYYARPSGEWPRLDSTTPDGGPGANQQALLGWIARNRDEYGANAGYVDIIGNRYCGDILTIARLIRDRFPAGTVIEYGIDCYPAAMMFSGSLNCGGAYTPEKAVQSTPADRAPFPRLSRALFRDRIVFFGGVNGDSVWWGRKAMYRAERNAFLLGAKLDALEMEDEPNSGRLNAAIEAIVVARRRSDWWRREPVYRDVLEISDVSRGTDVRRFTGKNGEELFVVDNWAQQAKPTFRFRGREVQMGGERLMIAVLGKDGVAESRPK